ncbi:hypothetical protein [Arcobacter sp. YIC-310]|uniref:hypothetical protein n=1 Tax=Arcobacter sp. YIC-310 TaxID=3376632 RepID=UPI003C1C81C8
MPILKAKSFLHEYKLRAKDEDLNSLSGRQGRKELTYFILLLSEEEVNATLKYISKVSKHNATIYIGELPFLNEFEDKSYGNSIFKWLVYGLKNRGFSYFLLVY